MAVLTSKMQILQIHFLMCWKGSKYLVSEPNFDDPTNLNVGDYPGQPQISPFLTLRYMASIFFILERVKIWALCSNFITIWLPMAEIITDNQKWCKQAQLRASMETAIRMIKFPTLYELQIRVVPLARVQAPPPHTHTHMSRNNYCANQK